MLVGDRQLQPVAEDLQLVLVQLLRLVGDVAPRDPRTERPPLQGLGEDHRRPSGVGDRGRVGGVDLAVVVAATTELGEVVIGQVLDELAQPWIRPEEGLADRGAVAHGEALEVAVERLVHLVEQDAVLVARQQVVPLARPDDLDHVPAGAAEDRLELLDDLSVAANRTVEALQVAVHDEGEVVEALAGRRLSARSSRARPSRRRQGMPRRRAVDGVWMLAGWRCSD